jgi:hypothetical protein
MLISGKISAPIINWCKWQFTFPAQPRTVETTAFQGLCSILPSR